MRKLHHFKMFHLQFYFYIFRLFLTHFSEDTSMKKNYISPRLEITELKAADILCASYIKYDIVEERNTNQQGETPPVYMG